MDDEVKSAFELAMERISALPQLTPQEMAEQKEKENAPVGRAIAVKYLNGALSVEDLPAELSRYGEDRQQSIRRALLAVLCREMRFGNPLREATKALRGIEAVEPRKRHLCEQAASGFQRILEEFESVKQEMSAKLATLARQRMKESGIGGSAVRPNLNEDGGWLEELSAIERAHEPQLEALRETLLRESPLA